MAIDKKLICFARLAEFERQLAAGNILEYSIVLIQDAKKIYNRGTFYDCNGGSSVYAWEWDGSESGSFSQEEFNKMKSADIVVVKLSDQMYVADCSYAENSIQLLIHTGTTQMLASQIFTISPEGWQLTETQVYSIPTKVSELENDSNFLDEDTADGRYAKTYQFGELIAIVEAKALDDQQLIYALPTSATGDEDDVIVTRNTLKTINNQSLLGEGNIEISGESFWYEEEDGNITTDYPVSFSQAATFINGIKASTSTPDGSISKGLAGQVLTTNGEKCYWATPSSEDIRYFTEFTFDEFINACKNESYISSNGLYDAIINNKLICIPNGDAGYIVSNSNYIEASHVENMYFFSLRVEAMSIVYEASIDTDDLTKDSLAGSLPLKRFVIQESLSSPNENGFYQDNTVYFISNEVDTLVINAYGISGNAYGTTICFTTGDDPVLEIVGDVLWANGAAPEIEANTTYELSLRADVNYTNILAVLVPFKSA